jgi:hypothetical protein
MASLTPNCLVPVLCGSKLTPLTLQVTDIKKLAATTPGTQERYRVAFSDGTHSTMGMMGTSLNHVRCAERRRLEPSCSHGSAVSRQGPRHKCPLPGYTCVVGMRRGLR